MHRVFLERGNKIFRGEKGISLSITTRRMPFPFYLFHAHARTRTHAHTLSLLSLFYRHTLHALVNLAIVLVDTR